ncbi:MAG: S8 family serine peptidase [Formosimonas sp.]
MPPLASAQAIEQEASTGGFRLSIDLGSIIRLLAHPKEDPLYERGQIQILWTDAAQAKAGIRALEIEQQLNPIQVENLNHLGLIIALYQLPNHSDALSMRDQLRNAHPNWIVDLNGLQEPQGARLYALEQMHMSQANLNAPLLKKMRIGVIDGPFNSNAQLHVNALNQHSVLLNEEQPASPQHGNAIASLLAGAAQSNGFIGAAPHINLSWAIATRQINGRESTNSFLMSKALNWLVGQQVKIINISMGGTGDLILSTVLQYVERQSIVVLAAAGNGGASAAPVYPAAYTSVLAVTAVDSAQNIYRQANHGSYIDVAASGVDVWTPTSGYVSGTSYASVLATGALARLGGAHSKSDALTKLCRHALDLGSSGPDKIFGCGLIQLK